MGREKFKAHLVAVIEAHGATSVYAVVALTSEAALAQVRAIAAENTQVEIVGGLSWVTAHHLGLKPGEMRPI
ncbi:hypothetical protein [Methylobacterium sp. CM6257]